MELIVCQVSAKGRNTVVQAATGGHKCRDGHDSGHDGAVRRHGRSAHQHADHIRARSGLPDPGPVRHTAAAARGGQAHSDGRASASSTGSHGRSHTKW